MRQPTPEQLLADLVWVVNSPSLIDSDADVASIVKEDVDLDRLTNFFGAGVPRRVGHYFERLVHFWLVHVRHVEMVAHGMPIRDGKVTLGELDFLFRDEMSRLTHLEVAVKFYLHHADSRIEGSHFIGPNVKDTFERKMRRMFDHQLPLSRHHVEGVVVREAMVKGRIFYASTDPTSIDLPALMSPDHLRCRWMRRGEFRSIPTPTSIRYRVIEKPFWLSTDQRSFEASVSMKKHEIDQWLHDRAKREERPVLINQLVESDGIWNEMTRCFIVPDNWPW